MDFDADALLAALPRRPLRQVPVGRVPRASKRIAPEGSALGEPGEYNGFSAAERNRTAALSSRLEALGVFDRPTWCDICGAAAADEHAEDYYDLTTWIGLCRRCHRNALHKRFSRPEAWAALLDECELADGHWARLVSPKPFDLAGMLRARGVREPTAGSLLTQEGSAPAELRSG